MKDGWRHPVISKSESSLQLITSSEIQEKQNYRVQQSEIYKDNKILYWYSLQVATLPRSQALSTHALEPGNEASSYLVLRPACMCATPGEKQSGEIVAKSGKDQ